MKTNGQPEPCAGELTSGMRTWLGAGALFCWSPRMLCWQHAAGTARRWTDRILTSELKQAEEMGARACRMFVQMCQTSSDYLLARVTQWSSFFFWSGWWCTSDQYSRSGWGRWGGEALNLKQVLALRPTSCMSLALIFYCLSSQICEMGRFHGAYFIAILWV